MTNNDWTEPNPGTSTTGPGTADADPASPAPPSAGPRVPPGASFFAGVRRLGIVRPEHGRRGAGVCAGIARRLAVAPLVVRIVAVLAALLGIGVLFYGVAWLLLPQEDGRIHAEALLAGSVTPGAIAAIVVSVLGLGDAPTAPLYHPYHSGGAGGLLIVAVAVVGVVVYTRRHRRLG